MTEQETQALYARALHVNGRQVQVIKALEELAELGAALAQWQERGDVESLIALHGELADVRIMLEQVEAWTDSAAIVATIREAKLARLAARLDEAEGKASLAQTQQVTMRDADGRAR